MEERNLETLPITRAEFTELEIFKNVTFECLAGYLLSCKTIDAEEGTLLIDPDNPQRRLIIVVNGSLDVRAESNGGVFTDIIEAGHCAGEMSVFDNIKPNATVCAREYSRLLIIPPDIALAMLNASHDLCLNFLHILSQRIRNNSKMVCEEQYHIRCIEENARVDSLTGLHNRRWLEEMYTRELERSNRGDLKLTAFMLDIDHFKNINDTYGHLAGDQVLIYVAQTLTTSLRPADMPVRYGGEEFSVFLPGISSENAQVIAERVRSNMENMQIILSTGAVIKVTVSVGLADRLPSDSVRDLIQRADAALYHAKESGRNRICLNKDTDGMVLL